MEITFNPAGELPHVLRALAGMLTTLADAAGVPHTDKEAIASTLGLSDRPDTGKEQRMVFPGGGEVKPIPMPAGAADLAAAFGPSGNVAAPSPIAPSPLPAPTVATLPPIPTATPAPDVDSPAPDLAVIFGGNKGTGPLALPPGVPPAPSNGGATAGASIQVDSAGLPWDARIHSSNKKFVATTGVWQRRRNVSDALVAQVEAELGAAVSVGKPPAPWPFPEPTPTPIPSPPTTASAGGFNTFATILPRVTSAINAGQLTPEACSAILSELSGGKVTAVAMLAIAPNLIPLFADKLTAAGVP